MNPSTHTPSSEQLPLLPVPEVPLQFRLDAHTRRLGLANVASIKAALAAQEARRQVSLSAATGRGQRSSDQAQDRAA